MFSNINKIENSLKRIGIRKGDVVSIVSLTTPELIYLFYALNHLGAVANMLDPRMPKHMLLKLTKKANSKNIFILNIFNETCKFFL